MAHGGDVAELGTVLFRHFGVFVVERAGVWRIVRWWFEYCAIENDQLLDIGR